MHVFIFSLDDGSVCQVMNQNVPKPMFLGRAFMFLFFPKNMYHIFCINTTYISGPPRAQMECPWRAHPGPSWSAHGGTTQGPDGVPWGSAASASRSERTLRSQPGPPPIAPKERIRSQGTRPLPLRPRKEFDLRGPQQ